MTWSQKSRNAFFAGKTAPAGAPKVAKSFHKSMENLDLIQGES